MEINREEELEYVSPEMDMVGINNRNLTTFETDIYTSFRLASQVPVACLKVAESGIRAMETVVALRRLGFRGFLIGEHFMREAQPAQALKNFVGYADYNLWHEGTRECEGSRCFTSRYVGFYFL